MNIGKPFDADGSELKPGDIIYTSMLIRWGTYLQSTTFKLASLTGIYSHPPAFQCQTKPRSTAANEFSERRAAALAHSAGLEDMEVNQARRHANTSGGPGSAQMASSHLLVNAT